MTRMNLKIRQSRLRGAVEIPGSKSHTIRAVCIAALAKGESRIQEPLISADTLSAAAAYSALGATIEKADGFWTIRGVDGLPKAPADHIDVGNSGTTLNLTLGSASLLRKGEAIFTGDEQIQRRPSAPLAKSLTDLGARVVSLKNNGAAPFRVEGTLSGGETTIEASSSQYLSSLLFAAPLADGDSHIRVPLLNERPYVYITLDWLSKQGIRLEYPDDLSEFRITGGQRFIPIDQRIPADFSSATFFLCAGALPGNEVTSNGLDITDTQGDKAVVDMIKALGSGVSINAQSIQTCSKSLRGIEIDMNATPDALPMLATLACFAEGETRLVNVPQARAKETDRIAVMAMELGKLGADIEELKDGLLIRRSDLRAATVDGHGDHRVVMSLAIGATAIPGETTILGAEAASITYPQFTRHLAALGADLEEITAKEPATA